jgi:hypothetical protein
MDNLGKVTKISIVGYSLGGLISRFAIGILYHQGLFEHVEPVNFTTFCTPHVGVLTPGSNISIRLFNQIIPSLLSLSGKQMFLKDNQKFGKALLALMANPNSVFYKGLQYFKYRQLYANAINDKRTAWWTSGISIVDPFVKVNENSSLDSLEFRYVPSYHPIVIDATSEFIISNKVIKEQDGKHALVPDSVPQSNFWARKLKWVTFGVNFLFFAPLWIIWFIFSNIVESLKSYKRIRESLTDNAIFFSKLADVSEMDAVELSDNEDDFYDEDGYSDVESMKSALETFDEQVIQNTLQDRADDLMESLWGAMTSKNDAENAEIEQYEIKQWESDTTDEIVPEDLNTDDIPRLRASIQDLSYFAKDSPQAQNEVLRPFTLDLSEDQLEIVKNLNQLEWEKYPILIRHTKSTHSAAIVRNIDETALFEGKTVIAHWLSKVFKMH